MTHTPFPITCSHAAIEAEAQVDGEAPKLATVSINAYTGAPINTGYYGRPVVIDIKGMQLSESPIPIYRDHNSSQILGHGIAKVKGGQVVMDGVLSGLPDEVNPVIQLAKNGFPWQASVGFQPTKIERVEADQVTKANGAEVKGPAYVVRAGYLYEVSIVAVGADRNTTTAIAAQQKLGGDPVSKENTPAEEEATEASKNNQPTKSGAVEAMLNEIKAERERQNEIARIASEAIRGGADLDTIEKLSTHAIEAKQSVTQFELAILREQRYKPAIHASGDHGADFGQVLECALAESLGGIDVEKEYPERVLEATHKKFPHGIKLGELLRISARRHGYSAESSHPTRDFLRQAFAPIQASGGASAYDVSGILSNVANKAIMTAFMAVESTWRDIAAIGRVSNFLTHTRYALTGDMTYEKIGNDGELKHATAGERSYTNRAETYGKIFAITRQDLINDDLGALGQVRMRLGRGAALAMNDVFWATFMDNASFFSSGNGNYISGSTTNLSVDSLTTLEATFLNQTDPNGKPMGLTPAILLVPNALSSLATTLMSSNEVRDTTANSKTPTLNPHVGKFRVVRSSYLSNASFTGNSTTAWHLLADPADMATIEMVFLNGVENPTIESADADFENLGIKLRGYHDFGCNLQEFRAGAKSKGAA